MHEVEFRWSPGHSRRAKQQSIAALHKAAKDQLGVQKPLEISSYSPEPVGQKLSSFTLSVSAPDGTPSTVEAVYQGCKIFEDGSSFPELFRKHGRDARRDRRLVSEAGERRQPVAFRYGTHEWPADGSTAFYDWLYIRGLLENPELALELKEYDAFTDIAFNPMRSLNCQARAAAVYLALLRQLGNREELILLVDDVGEFKRLHALCAPSEPHAQNGAEHIAATADGAALRLERPAPLSVPCEAQDEPHPSASTTELLHDVEKPGSSESSKTTSTATKGTEQLELFSAQPASATDTPFKKKRTKPQPTRRRRRKLGG